MPTEAKVTVSNFEGSDILQRSYFIDDIVNHHREMSDDILAHFEDRLILIVAIRKNDKNNWV